MYFCAFTQKKSSRAQLLFYQYIGPLLCCLLKLLGTRYVFVVDLDCNSAIWQHSIVEMLACAWQLCSDSECQQINYLIKTS